jgi:hypothetical protein
MKKKITLLCLITVLAGLFSGCRLIRIEEEEPQPLEYTIISREDLPQELEVLIEAKKQKEFWLTYQSQDDLYLVRGYGRQISGGYSISVEQLGVTAKNICFKTQLIGPPDTSQSTEISYPYIVVKIKYREEPVIFE